MKILFVCYGGGHVNITIPIVKKLRETTDYDLIVLGLTTAKHKLERERIPSIGFKDLIESDDNRAIEIGETLSGGITNSNVSRDETIAYLGLSYIDLEQRYGQDKAMKLYEEKGRKAFLPITVMERFFKKVKPDLVVATSSPRAEQAAIIAARNMNIPSICIYDWFIYMKNNCKWLADSSYADKVCVLSETVKNNLIKEGRKREDVVVTGNPAFDYLGDTKLYDQGKEYRKKYGWSKKKVILWASQQEPNNPNLPREIEKKLFEIVAKYDDIHLIIRFHPNEEVKLDNLPERVYISNPNENLVVLLNSVDLVITMTSTVGLEAIMIDKLLITIDMSEFTRNAPYSKLGLSIGVAALDNLEHAIIESLSSKQKEIKELIPKPGNAATNITEVIKEIALKNSNDN